MSVLSPVTLPASSGARLSSPPVPQKTLGSPSLMMGVQLCQSSPFTPRTTLTRDLTPRTLEYSTHHLKVVPDGWWPGDNFCAFGPWGARGEATSRVYPFLLFDKVTVLDSIH